MSPSVVRLFFFVVWERKKQNVIRSDHERNLFLNCSLSVACLWLRFFFNVMYYLFFLTFLIEANN